MRGSRGVSSRDIAKVVHFLEPEARSHRSKRLIEGVSERVDCSARSWCR